MIYDLQKASMWKRISAFLFDAILLGIVSVFAAWAISVLVGYDSQIARVDAAYERYGEQYGVNFDMSLEEYEAQTPEQLEAVNAAYAAMAADPEATEAYGAVVQTTLLILSLGILMGYALMEFAIPLKIGSGQSLGKKIFGIGLMQQDGVQVNSRVLFVRTFLGKYTLETMVPVMILLMIWFGMLGLIGTLVLLGILLIQIVLVCRSRRMLIHDMLAGTVAVDYASQMIFPDREARIAYQKKAHAEKAAREPY